MAASGNHLYAPAHAHLNLLGWVSIALFGAYYTLFPQAAASTLAKVQLGCMHLGTILMFPGVILAINGAGEGLAKAGSLFAIISMVLFAFIAAKTKRRPSLTVRTLYRLPKIADPTRTLVAPKPIAVS